MNFRSKILIVGAGASELKESLSMLMASRPCERIEIVALANEGEQVEGLANEFNIGSDGWVRIAPYGDHLKERIVLEAGQRRQEAFVQRLDKPAAEEMVRRFKSLWGRAKRFVLGLPIFKHHPDLNDHSPQTVAGLANDKREYGMFSDLEAREDGLYGRPVMSKAGQEAIENEKLKYLSPFWWAKAVGETANKIKVVSPFELISAGLTDRPNISGGEALANAKEKEREKMMNAKLHAALVAAGVVALANDATDDQIIQAVEGLGKRAGTAEAALANEKTARTTAESQLQSEKSAREVAERERGEAKAALANERKARVGLILDQALQEGRITPAQRPQWATDLEALQGKAFDDKVAALANERSQMSTRAQTANLGARKNEADQTADLTQQVVGLVNERMAKHPHENYDQAFNAVRREKAELFERMKAPEQS